MWAIACLALWCAEARGTPEASQWHRETLIGENASVFLRFVSVRDQPGSSYSFAETLRVEVVRKADLRVVKNYRIHMADFEDSSADGHWSVIEEPQPAFDLSKLLRVNKVWLAFSDDLQRSFEVSESGVNEVFEDGKIQLLSGPELMRQIPMLGSEPRIAGIETTALVQPNGESACHYLLLRMNSAAMDDDWSEYVLMIPGGRLR